MYFKLKRLSHLLKSISKSGDFQFHWDALKASYEASDSNNSKSSDDNNPKSPLRQVQDQFTQTDDHKDQSESNRSKFISGIIKNNILFILIKNKSINEYSFFEGPFSSSTIQDKNTSTSSTSSPEPIVREERVCFTDIPASLEHNLQQQLKGKNQTNGHQSRPFPHVGLVRWLIRWCPR